MHPRTRTLIPIALVLATALGVAGVHAQQQQERSSERDATQEQESRDQDRQTARRIPGQEPEEQQTRQQQRPDTMTEAFREEAETGRQAASPQEQQQLEQQQQQQQRLQQFQQQQQQQTAQRNWQQVEQRWTELAQEFDQEFTHVYPTGETEGGMLGVRVRSVGSVPMDSAYPYEITVENVSDTPLAGVTIVQDSGQRLDFVAASVSPQQEPNNQQRWVIGAMEPGQTETIRAMAVPREQGAMGVCLAFIYEPALCTTVDVVQPNLELTKEAPEASSLCEPVPVRYVVRNPGTGTAENVVITDPLSEGLTTVDGEQQVKLEVGNLPAGESREMTVELTAARMGEFASRATARSANNEARSQETRTRITAADLRVSARGPEWQYSGEPINYTVTIENVGRSVAQDASLVVTAGDEEREPYQLGDIEPGQTETLNVTIEPGAGDQLSMTATATAQCVIQEARDQASTQIRRMPALLLETVDNTDPVRVGDNTVYTISVKNQGDAPAKNVTVTAKLPQEFEVVDVSGDTEAQQSGQNLQFQQIAELPPGEVATWRLEAKANTAADVRLETQLESDFLDRPVPDVEPTRIY